MNREPALLENQHFDLLVIGGGIYGVFIAWDAALRGLKTALVERDDFGGATSANSLKISHGGLRYLERGRLGLASRMEKEQRVLAHIAPHLVQPMPFLMPLLDSSWKRRAIVQAGLVLYNLLKAVSGVAAGNLPGVPGGRVISPAACRRMAPLPADRTLSGGACWYDVQIENSERLTVEVVRAAASAGATVANHMEATELRLQDGRVCGVKARDRLTGSTVNIRARMVVNAAGPWLDTLLSRVAQLRQKPRFLPSLAFNLVTRQILPDLALAVPRSLDIREGQAIQRARSRALVLVPWQGYTIIGTQHLPVERECSQAAVSESMIADFIAEINAALPAADLGREDVVAVQAGLLPVEDNGDGHEIRLVPDSLVIDHHDENGLGGLVSVVGVKYSLARDTAERAVDQVARRLGKPNLPCRTGTTLLPGGSSDSGVVVWRDLPDGRRHDLDEATLRRLLRTYGPEVAQLLRYLDENPSWGAQVHDTLAVTSLEVIHAVRVEMARRLEDVVLRRLGPIFPGMLSADALLRLADLMSAELGWTEHQKQAEIETVLAAARQTIGVQGGNS